MTDATEKPKRLTGRTKSVIAHITQPIIDRAEAKNSNHCMIADAIRAVLPDVKTVSVDMATIRWTDPVKRQRYVYLTPPRAQLALVRFDQGQHEESFDIKLAQPIQVVAMAERKVQPDGTTKRSSRARQGIAVVGGGSRRPVLLGGPLPPKDELNMGGAGKTNRSIAAAEKRAVTAKVTREAAEAAAAPAPKGRGGSKPGTEVPRSKTVTRAQAEKAAADRAKGLPATEHSNITMTNRRHVREFGLKQLKA